MSSPSPSRAVVLWALGALAGGCATSDAFIWVDDLPKGAVHRDSAYLIRRGDLLSVQVWNQEQLSPKVRVRGDGFITLPLVGDILAEGATPPGLGAKIRAALLGYVNNPQVEVGVEEMRPATVSVIGEVVKAGEYPLSPGAGVLSALASAGGMNEFAARDRIFVLRHHSPPVRIRFKYEALARARGAAAIFELLDGDVVVVE